MCFSATASFTAGIALSGLGVASVMNARKPNQYAFAGIPLLFGVQQVVEGILWISLTNPQWQEYQSAATYAFLVIAQVLWPVCLPLAFILFEEEKRRKKLMKICLGTGIAVAMYFSYCLITFHVASSIREDHIFYALDYPRNLIPIAAFFYVISTVTAPLLSRNRKIQWMGLIILIFYMVSRLYFQPSLISVWCFFAAVISLIVYWVMREKSLSLNSATPLAA